MKADVDHRSGPLSALKDRFGRAAPEAGASTVRSRLFVKYLALFVLVVSLALVTNGAFEVWFSYQDHTSSLLRIERAQADSAANKIGQFIDEIKSQIGWTTRKATWSSAVSTRCGFCGRSGPLPNWRRSTPPDGSNCGYHASLWK
jgi:hypothetical protein